MRSRGSWRWLGASVVALSLAGCAGILSAKPTATPAIITKVGWCAKPAILFSDESANPAQTVTAYASINSALTFQPLVPAQYPGGTCLVSVGGTLRDPNFGSRMILIYHLAGTGAISLVETPKQKDQAAPVCTGGALAGEPYTTCQQTIGPVNVTVSSTRDQVFLTDLLAHLSAKLNWVPAGTPAQVPTPTPISTQTVTPDPNFNPNSPP